MKISRSEVKWPCSGQLIADEIYISWTIHPLLANSNISVEHCSIKQDESENTAEHTETGLDWIKQFYFFSREIANLNSSSTRPQQSLFIYICSNDWKYFQWIFDAVRFSHFYNKLSTAEQAASSQNWDITTISMETFQFINLLLWRQMHLWSNVIFSGIHQQICDIQDGSNLNANILFFYFGWMIKS